MRMRQILILLFLMGLINLSGLFGQNKTKSNYLTLEWSDVKDRIYPMLKQSLPDTDPTPLIELKENEKPITESFTDDVHIVFLIDFYSHFTYVNHGQLSKWNISKDYLRETAIFNLDQIANGQAKFHGDSEYALITLNGNFEASLILSDFFGPTYNKWLRVQTLSLLFRHEMFYLYHIWRMSKGLKN